MKGRNTFTRSEINILRELFKLKDEASSCEQKKIRDKMRKMGFYITCLLYTSPSPRDPKTSRMPSSA